MRAGAGPGCGELKTKGLLRFPPARGCGGLRGGGGSTEAGAPEVLPACAPRSPQQTASRQLSLVLWGTASTEVGAPSSRLPTPGPSNSQQKSFRFKTPRSAQNSTDAPEPRGHPDPRVSNMQGATPSLTIYQSTPGTQEPQWRGGAPQGPSASGAICSVTILPLLFDQKQPKSSRGLNPS